MGNEPGTHFSSPPAANEAARHEALGGAATENDIAESGAPKSAAADNDAADNEALKNAAETSNHTNGYNGIVDTSSSGPDTRLRRRVHWTELPADERAWRSCRASRKGKYCDIQRPTCGSCLLRGVECEWDDGARGETM